jgi:hypothetical protein
MDRFSKVCLSLIVALLAVIALRPAIAPQSVHAAQPRTYTYLWLGAARLDEIETELTGMSKKGFEVVGVTTYGPGNNQILFVLAK